MATSVGTESLEVSASSSRSREDLEEITSKARMQGAECLRQELMTLTHAAEAETFETNHLEQRLPRLDSLELTAETNATLDLLQKELLSSDAAAAILNMDRRLQQLQDLVAKLQDAGIDKIAAKAGESQSTQLEMAGAVKDLQRLVDRVCGVTAKVASAFQLTAAENAEANQAVSLLNGEIRNAVEELKGSPALEHDERLQRCLRKVQSVERASIPKATGGFGRLWDDSFRRHRRQSTNSVPHAEPPNAVLSVVLPSPSVTPIRVTGIADASSSGDPLQQMQSQNASARARVKDIAERGTNHRLSTSPLPPAAVSHQRLVFSARGRSTQESVSGALAHRPVVRLLREAAALGTATTSCSESQHQSPPLTPGASLIIRAVSPSPLSTPVRSPARTPAPSRSPSLERRSEMSLELSEKDDVDPRLQIRPRTVPPLPIPPHSNESRKLSPSPRPQTARQTIQIRQSRLGGD